MAKTIFEETGGSYSRHGDYNLADIASDEQNYCRLGKYERMRKKFLKEHRHVTYLNLLTSCTMSEHLAHTDAEAEKQIEIIAAQMKQLEGVTELLKSENQTEWVMRMNNILAHAEEFVFNEIVYR